MQGNNLAKDIMQLWKKLQEEMLQRGAQREETQSTLGTFRQDVDTVSLALLDLERKVDSLQEETDFLKKLHNDESGELRLRSKGSMGKLGCMFPSQKSRRLCVMCSRRMKVWLRRTFRRLKNSPSPSLLISVRLLIELEH